MSHLNWPLLGVLAALFAPPVLLRIWLTVTLDKRVEKKEEQFRDEQARVEAALQEQRFQVAEQSEKTGVPVCSRCRLRLVTYDYRGEYSTMCPWCGI